MGTVLVSKPAGHGVARQALAPAATTPPVRLKDPARQHRPLRLEPLPGDLQTKLVEAAERGQIRAREGSVGHVGVFQMDGVGTFILGRPRRLSRDRRADPTYTLKSEEPVNR